MKNKGHWKILLRKEKLQENHVYKTFQKFTDSNQVKHETFFQKKKRPIVQKRREASCCKKILIVAKKEKPVVEKNHWKWKPVEKLQKRENLLKKKTCWKRKLIEKNDWKIL